VEHGAHFLILHYPRSVTNGHCAGCTLSQRTQQTLDPRPSRQLPQRDERGAARSEQPHDALRPNRRNVPAGVGGTHRDGEGGGEHGVNEPARLGERRCRREAHPLQLILDGAGRLKFWSTLVLLSGGLLTLVGKVAGMMTIRHCSPAPGPRHPTLFLKPYGLNRSTANEHGPSLRVAARHPTAAC
jgi:hypothetical protein